MSQQLESWDVDLPVTVKPSKKGLAMRRRINRRGRATYREQLIAQDADAIGFEVLKLAKAKGWI